MNIFVICIILCSEIKGNGVSVMKNSKKTAVMYGAGRVGRGFIGQVFFDSGFEVVFVDVNKDIVAALNKRNSYTQLIVDGDAVERREISGVFAMDGHDRDAVARVISGCDIMAVAVGAAFLPSTAPFLASGLSLRERPLNILVCENLVNAPGVLRGLLSEFISDSSKLDKVGFVGTTIGRMVPVVPPEQCAGDPTLIAVEPFCTLPLDGDAVVQPMPELMYTVLCNPFAFEEGKKLYIHNMGHALAAYFGFLQGYSCVWQAVKDEFIRDRVQKAMSATAEALAKKYGECRAGLSVYADDLLHRFGNSGLGDSIARVGGDPLRKLAPGDRLMGAVDLCIEQGVDYSSILSGVAAALRFDAANDPSAGRMHERLAESGISTFLRDYCGFSEADAMSVMAARTKYM